MAFNILEHFPAHETFRVLEEWARVVQVGGWLDLLVPDSISILNAHYAGEMNWKDCAVRLRGTSAYLNQHLRAFTLPEFPAIIEQVPILRLKVCEASHEDCGIHTIAVRVRG